MQVETYPLARIDRPSVGLERDLQSALDRVIDLTEAGDSKRASRYSALAGNIERQISDNCLVVF
jgi:hypothetical protein